MATGILGRFSMVPSFGDVRVIRGSEATIEVGVERRRREEISRGRVEKGESGAIVWKGLGVWAGKFHDFVKSGSSQSISCTIHR